MKTKKKLYQMPLVALLGLLGACNAEETIESGTAVLQPAFNLVAGNGTRSIVTGTGGTANGQINTVGVYVARQHDGAAYPGVSANPVVFTKNGESWTAATDIRISNETAQVYAYSPSGLPVTNVATGGNHTIAVTLPQEQTFNLANGWACSATDYLYGSSSGTVGAEDAVTATNQSFQPEVYLQHACAQVIVKIQNAQSRPADDTYDYVRSIKITTTSGTPFMTGSGTMWLKNGAYQNLTAGNAIEFKPLGGSTPGKVGAAGSPVTVAYGLVAPLSAQPAAVSFILQLGKRDDATVHRELTLTTDQLKVQWLKGRCYTYSLELGVSALKLTEEVAISGWTSQSNEDIPVQPDGFLSVQAAIASSTGAITRAAITERTTFDDKDVIRITRTKGAATTSASYTYTKSRAGAGSWGSTAPLSPDAGATYQGMYPADYAAILSDQQTEGNYRKSDKLATPSGVTADTKGIVSFTGTNAFSHQNCKLTLKFAGELALTSAPAFEVKGTGLVTGAERAEAVQPYKEEDFQYTAVVYPKGTTAITVAMTYNDVAYTATVSCPLASGTAYTYTLKLANNVLVPVGTEITPWVAETITGELTDK